MIPANEALLVGVCLQAKRSRQNGDIGLRNVQSVVLAVGVHIECQVRWTVEAVKVATAVVVVWKK